MKSNHAPIPPSLDHVVRIQPDRDIILALDEEGKELARLAFEVEGRMVCFQTPTLAKFPMFSQKLGHLFLLLSAYIPNVELPESFVETHNGKVDKVWDKISGVMIASAPVIKSMILDLFFKYLDVKIGGVSTKRKWWGGKSDSQKWFENNVRITDCQKVLSACLMVDDLVKKNATFLLQRAYSQKSAEQSSKLTLVKKPDSPSSPLTLTPSSLFDSL